MPLLVRAARPADAPAVLALLGRYPGLEVAFDPSEFVVVAEGAAIVACGRLRHHGDGALELASVAAEPGRHGAGLGSAVVKALLAGVDGPVYALALAPGFFARHGFREVAKAGLPASVRAKADGLCASQPYAAMVRP